MEKELVRYLLKYLLENNFTSIADMADRLRVSKRNLQRILNGKSSEGESNSMLSQILLYFSEWQISLERPFTDFARKYDAEQKDKETVLIDNHHGESWLSIPDWLPAEGVQAFKSFNSFLDILSQHICPSCHVPQKKCQTEHCLENVSCSISSVAMTVCRELEHLYRKPQE